HAHIEIEFTAALFAALPPDAGTGQLSRRTLRSAHLNRLAHSYRRLTSRRASGKRDGQSSERGCDAGDGFAASTIGLRRAPAAQSACAGRLPTFRPVNFSGLGADQRESIAGS